MHNFLGKPLNALTPKGRLGEAKNIAEEQSETKKQEQAEQLPARLRTDKAMGKHKSKLK